MDAKEAIKALNTGIAEAKQHYERRKDEDDIIMIELFSVCVEALEKVPVLEAENARLREKETPKKPVQNIYSYSAKNDRYCPICKSWLNGRRKSDVPNFCNHCGQAIKNDKE